jgi:Ran GTPase-activating protein (RanGAP) involved in mRNA processing and transport
MAEDSINIRYYMHGTTDTCCINDQTLTDDQVEFISLNLPSTCTSLSLARTELTLTSIGFLATNLLLRGNSLQSNLKYLYLYNTKLTDEGVQLLCRALIDGQNKKLQKLDIQLNPGITEIGAHEIARMLAVNQGLKVLDLSYNSIGRRGVFEVCQSLDMKNDATLQYLDISFNLTSAEKTADQELNELLERLGQRVHILNY